MGRHVVAIATSEKLTQSDARFVQLVVSAWPDASSPPRMPRITHTELLHHATVEDLSNHARPVVLMFVTADDSIDEIDRCITELRQSGLAAVVLCQDAERWMPMQGQGVVVRGWDCPPDVVSAMLFALSERQAHIDALAREVALLQRCQAGVRTEVERIHEELHLAAGVQQEFNASALPVIDELDVGVLYRPVNAVSGDIYSVRAIGPTLTAFFVADAVGHGVPAALLTMILTSTLVGAEGESVSRPGGAGRPTPAQVLERLNRRLVASSLQTGRFATAAYGTIDHSTGAVVVAGAGHPAPLVLARDGTTRELETQGPLLGVFDDAEYDQATTTLRPGESLLLYTDGFEAAFPRLATDPKRHRHLEHAANVLRSCDGQAEKALRELEVMLDEQAGSLHQADDITVLALTLRSASQLQTLHAARAA